MAAETTPGATFERRASGLVREAGTLDVLIYNINFVSLGLMAALVFLFSTAFYPGANLYVTALLTFLVVIPTSLVFAFFAASMPRSGADYVFVSRALHPALGMMSSWNNTVWWFIYGGVPSAFFAHATQASQHQARRSHSVRPLLSPILRTFYATRASQSPPERLRYSTRGLTLLV